MIKHFFKSKPFFVLSAFLFFHSGLAAAQSYPQPDGYVTDQAGLIQDADRQRVVAWVQELQEKTGAQVAVVTVATIGQETIEGYAAKLFEKWGVGQKKKDNGVLLVIAAQEHRLRVEVGYGLEGALTDAQSSGIINNVIVPQFKVGQFSVGITKGVWAIVSIVAAEYNIQISGQPAYTSAGSESESNSLVWFLVFGGILFLLVFLNRRGGIYPGGYWYGGGGGYSGGGGGFSGGFGGFGGGMSGGGGSSGSW